MGSSCTPAPTSLGQGAFLGQQVTVVSSACLAKGVIQPHSSANFPPLGFAPSQPVSMSERPPRLPQVCPSVSGCQTMPHHRGLFPRHWLPPWQSICVPHVGCVPGETLTSATAPLSSLAESPPRLCPVMGLSLAGKEAASVPQLCPAFLDFSFHILTEIWNRLCWVCLFHPPLAADCTLSELQGSAAPPVPYMSSLTHCLSHPTLCPLQNAEMEAKVKITIY